MRSNEFNHIADSVTLYRQAKKLAVRAEQMSPDENGRSLIDPRVIDALMRVAENLEIFNPFGRAAQGVAFLQNRDRILTGQRSLQHNEACEALNFIVNRAAPHVVL